MLAEVEAFLRRTGMPWSTFGWQAVRDKRLVSDMRNGRLPRARTCQRVREWMASYEG